MNKHLRFALNHFIFWLCFFMSFRLLMLLLSFDFSQGLPIGEVLGVFWQGIRLDLSAAGYLFIIPLLMLPFIGGRMHNHILQWIRHYYRSVTAVCTLLCLANAVIFRFWGTMLNVRALEFALYPKEMLASISNVQTILIVVAIILICILMERMRKAILDDSIQGLPAGITQSIVAFLLLIGVNFTCIRGGWMLIPINEAAAAYSSNNTLNSISLNPLWYLGNNIYRSSSMDENPFEHLAKEDARAITERILENPLAVNPDSVLQNPKCNVVVILLESWTADVIEPLGGLPGVTPFFSSLAKQGLLCTRTYSSGFRTDQGLTSVLSGFPAIPDKSIIRFIDKTQKLPSLGKSFASAGYHNNFYYGGELGFANMNNYLLQSGFQNRTDISDFNDGEKNSKWGAHDEFLLQRMLADLDQAQQPFFNVLLTLSTHEPFESPRPTPFGRTNESEKFKGSAWYTDQCLQAFFTQAKTKPWYDQTLFVLIADHGHRLPLNRDYLDPAARRIPVLFYGQPLAMAFRGSTIDRTSSQHDVPATLLSIMGMDAAAFSWSRNMLGDPSVGFAYINQDQAITWMTANDTTKVDLVKGLKVGEDARMREILAYLQQLYDTFIGL